MTFAFSKIFWLFAQPANLLLALLLLGLLLGFTPWRRLGRWLTAVVALGFLVIAVVPLGDWLMQTLEQRFPAPATLPDQVDGIVVLGGAVGVAITVEYGRPALNGHAERMTEFVAMARKYPQAKLVFTGGSGTLLGDDKITEADVARFLFETIGPAPDRVIYESESRNTFENAVKTKSLVGPKDGETWLLITSAFHMPRAVGVFRKAGWEVQPYPVDYKSMRRPRMRFSLAGGLNMLHFAMHEWIGMIAYRLLGRMDEVFPAPGT